MNGLEKALLNSGPRAVLQRRYEVPLLLRLGGSLEGAQVLEVGCGRGVGTELLLEVMGAAHVHAIDLDPDQVTRARTRLARYGPDRVRVDVGDATALPAPDGTMDAVVDFAVFHHVPVWADAVAEAARVLRPGGRFFFEEVTAHALQRWSYRTLFDHPRSGEFTPEEFAEQLRAHDLNLTRSPVRKFFGDFCIGVAHKSTTI